MGFPNKSKQETLAPTSNTEISNKFKKKTRIIIALRKYLANANMHPINPSQVLLFCQQHNAIQDLGPPFNKRKPFSGTATESFSCPWNLHQRTFFEKKKLPFLLARWKRAKRVTQFYQINFHIWFKWKPKSLQNKFINLCVRFRKSQKPTVNLSESNTN